MLISIDNIVVHVIITSGLSMSFGHGVTFTIGLILFSLIFFVILGFGSST